MFPDWTSLVTRLKNFRNRQNSTRFSMNNDSTPTATTTSDGDSVSALATAREFVIGLSFLLAIAMVLLLLIFGGRGFLILTAVVLVIAVLLLMFSDLVVLASKRSLAISNVQMEWIVAAAMCCAVTIGSIGVTQAIITSHSKPVSDDGRQSRIKRQFSPWDGSHYNLVKAVKANMNDPDSFEHIETKYVDQNDQLLVIMKYRGRNGFGGVVTEKVSARFGIDGSFIGLEAGN